MLRSCLFYEVTTMSSEGCSDYIKFVWVMLGLQVVIRSNCRVAEWEQVSQIAAGFMLEIGTYYLCELV